MRKLIPVFSGHKLIRVFSSPKINTVFFWVAKLIPVFFTPKNKYCIYFVLDRASGQSGQTSVHLVEKKFNDFNRLSLTVFDSVQYCHLRKIQ